LVRRYCCSSLSSHFHHGIQNFAVAGAATDIATERNTYLVKIGMRILVEQFGSRHQHPWDAETALDKRLLERMQLRVLRQHFDGGDLSLMSLWRGYQTRHNGLPVEPDRAGSALAFCTSLFGSRQASILAQRIEQRLPLRIDQVIRLAVDGGFNDTRKS